MITNLNIKNVGIIDELSIDFNNGLNVLTGETGAGKTLIIDSLSIISGGRFSKEMIRHGESHSYVEACIYLPNNKYSEDENIIVSREINSSGKNLCKINGRMVTVSELKLFMQNIIDIHSQHDNQILMNPSNHIMYLDDFAGEKVVDLKEKYKIQYEKYNETLSQLEKNYGNDIEKRRMLDLLEYQYNEIADSNLTVGEDELIENKLKVIKNSEKISQALLFSNNELTENAIASMENAIKMMSKIESLDDKYSINLNSLKESYYNVIDIASQFSEFGENIEYSEELLLELQTRQEQIFSLKRKYGSSIEEVLKYMDKVKDQINSINNLETYIKALKKEKDIVESEMKKIALEIHEIRLEFASKLSERINLELSDLEMKNAVFAIDVNLSDKFNKNGLDNVEFVISTNVGDSFKPLVKIASGGEISRIMLAIKTVLSSVVSMPVMIFDEIDTGISGIAAKSVSEKIKKISKVSQILCVSHLAVIAARADYNYYINKEVVNNKTKTCIKLLDEEEAIKEIARIATGETSNIALEHAKSLRKTRTLANA